MAKEDLKLRVTSNAPLTTKGSPLTWAELDANWIAIYNAYVALSQSSYVDAYSAAVEYDDTINNYVMYSGQLWKCIAASPITAITPVEGTDWTAVYATDMVGKNLDLNVKKYKALLSQNAPIASQTSGTVIVGQIWSITTYVAGDDFSNWTLISGTGNTTGDVYQATTTAPTTWTNLSDLAYDGAPYIVSIDASGNLNPVTDTITDAVLNYTSAGDFTVTSASGKFTANKTFIKHKSIILYDNGFAFVAGSLVSRWVDVNTIQIYTQDSFGGTDTNDILTNEWFEIEVYP